MYKEKSKKKVVMQAFEDKAWKQALELMENEFSTKEINTLNAIPANISANDVLQFVNSGAINSNYIKSINELTHCSDEVVSDWLNVNVKTYRNYKNNEQELKRDMQERTLLLIALIKHGIEVFQSGENFAEWLKKKNFFFDDTAPADRLDTISGIKTVSDRLTAMEYGDNV
jgi:uncharacterized protein (DUF2384 family)